MTTELDKWKKAVIHLECAGDSKQTDERTEETFALMKLHREKQITDEEYHSRIMAINDQSRDKRYQGTAIFLKHNDRRYLLTARHVLWDEQKAKSRLERDKKESNFDPHWSMRKYDNALFSIIFRVPSIDELVANGLTDISLPNLMNLEAGLGTSYSYSEPELDLAVISLDRPHSAYKEFGDHLIARGYQPISIDDIAQEPSKEGEEIVAIGFPSSLALVAQLPNEAISKSWASSYVSVPITSFGKVSMSNQHIPFIWGDISIYPGNSGGPIISNNKLVGLVSAQATIGLDDFDQKTRVRVPFAKIIKGEHIISLLRAQIDKEDK